MLKFTTSKLKSEILTIGNYQYKAIKVTSEQFKLITEILGITHKLYYHKYDIYEEWTNGNEDDYNNLVYCFHFFGGNYYIAKCTTFADFQD